MMRRGGGVHVHVGRAPIMPMRPMMQQPMMGRGMMMGPPMMRQPMMGMGMGVGMGMGGMVVCWCGRQAMMGSRCFCGRWA